MVSVLNTNIHISLKHGSYFGYFPHICSCDENCQFKVLKKNIVYDTI